MKVLIVNNMAPFVWGGAEELAEHLRRNILLAGHQSEILRIPFQWEPADRIPSQMLMVRAFELFNVDHVIALKFPAYLIRHHRKTIWLLHQYRQAYDLFEVGQTNLPPGQDGLELKEFIRKADEDAFTESCKIYTNSQITRERLLRFNGFDSTVLLPPINDPELFIGGTSQNYIFAGGRINRMKRQHILLEALAKLDRRPNLIIAGPPDDPQDAAFLHSEVKRLGLSDSVKLDLRFLPRQVYADYVNGASAVAYLPYDEDSLGYVAMEAAMASKAILTTTDSGGILGLVKNSETGWVADPSAEDLAFAIDQVFKNNRKTRTLGENARSLWDSMNINWPRTIEVLLQ